MVLCNAAVFNGPSAGVFNGISKKGAAFLWLNFEVATTALW